MKRRVAAGVRDQLPKSGTQSDGFVKATSKATGKSKSAFAASAARGKLISERRGPYCGAHHDFMGVPMRQNPLSRRSEITAVGGRHRHVGKCDPLSAWGLNVPDPQIDESRSHGLPRPRRPSNCRIPPSLRRRRAHGRASIDENLMRHGLSPVQEAAAISRRKARASGSPTTRDRNRRDLLGPPGPPIPSGQSLSNTNTRLRLGNDPHHQHLGSYAR